MAIYYLIDNYTDEIIDKIDGDIRQLIIQLEKTEDVVKNGMIDKDISLVKISDSVVPIVDSITTSLSLVAMFLMARRKVENWIYWIIADLIYIPLYFYKGLLLTSFQFLIFLIIAILGYLSWSKKLNEKNINNRP